MANAREERRAAKGRSAARSRSTSWRFIRTYAWWEPIWEVSRIGSDGLAATLDRYPNFGVDTAARLPSLMLADRARVRAFFLKYHGRILYGTDLGFLPGADGSMTAARWRRQYLADWRYLATSDSFTYQGIQVRGLALPRTTLQKLCYDNSLRWIPGLAGNKRD